MVVSTLITCVLVCLSAMVGSYYGHERSIKRQADLLGEINSRWPAVITQLITTAPALLESASRFAVGAQEILQLIQRMGINRLKTPSRSKEPPKL